MIPDKIYVNKYMLRKGMMYPAQEPADVPEFEFIRKDVLLEWVKRRWNAYNSQKTFKRAFENGMQEAFNEVIDKLNSM